MLYNSLKRSILHNDLVSWTGHCRFSTKTCVSSCPFLSAIFFLPQWAHRTSHTLLAQRALCPEQRWRPLSLCARGLDLSRTIRIQKQATSTVAKRTGAAISINYFPVARARESRSVRWTIWSTVNALPWKYNSSTAGVDGKEGGGETFQAGAPYCLVPPYSLGYTSPRWLPPKAVWEAMLNSAHVGLSYSEMGQNDFICMSRNETMCQLNMSVSTGEWDCVC